MVFAISIAEAVEQPRAGDAFAHMADLSYMLLYARGDGVAADATIRDRAIDQLRNHLVQAAHPDVYEAMSDDRRARLSEISDWVSKNSLLDKGMDKSNNEFAAKAVKCLSEIDGGPTEQLVSCINRN